MDELKEGKQELVEQARAGIAIYKELLQECPDVVEVLIEEMMLLMKPLMDYQAKAIAAQIADEFAKRDPNFFG